MLKPRRELSHIEPQEVSLVKKPANQRNFLFYKADKLELNITTDGSLEGTVIKVNGEVLKEIDSFNFNFYKPSGPGPVNNISCIGCSYSKVVEAEDGFKRSETYVLSKGDITMDKELQELLKEYFGDKDTFEKKDISEEAVKALKEAVKTLNKYKGDFPDDLKKAVGTLAEYAASGYGYPEKKGDSNTANTNSNNTTSSNKATNGLTAEEVKALTEQLSKSVEEIKKSTQASTEALSNVNKTLDSLKTRLEKVESGVGIRKGIQGQDGAEDGEGDEKDDFPSLKI